MSLRNFWKKTVLTDSKNVLSLVLHVREFSSENKHSPEWKTIFLWKKQKSLQRYRKHYFQHYLDEREEKYALISIKYYHMLESDRGSIEGKNWGKNFFLTENFFRTNLRLA